MKKFEYHVLHCCNGINLEFNEISHKDLEQFGKQFIEFMNDLYMVR